MMRRLTLALRSVSWYRRPNAAVVLGVATAVSVLAGALAVGDSVRASLRKLALGRLGRAEHALVSSGAFREALADDLVAASAGTAAPLRAAAFVMLDGMVTHEESGRRAGGVIVYGVDDRFWRFHESAPPQLSGREALLSEALASELGAERGASLLFRIVRRSEISGASLFGERHDLGRTLRASFAGALPAARLGEFSLRPRQQALRAAFLPLRVLQKAVGWNERANAAVLESRRPERAGVPGAAAPGAARPRADPSAVLRQAASLEDMGLRLRVLRERGTLVLEAANALIGDEAARAAREAAESLGMRSSRVLTYLANTLAAGGREVPYSLVTALEDEALQGLGAKTLRPSGATAGAAGAAAREVAAPAGGAPRVAADGLGAPAPATGRPASAPAIFLNEWAARELGITGEAILELTYYVWLEEGRLETRSARFTVTGVVPLAGPAADRDFTPDYPGITQSLHLADWSPPFPVDLRKIRPQDEHYWDRHRTTPKAFVRLADGRRLWGHRLGSLTSVRIHPPAGADIEEAGRSFEDALRARLDPQQAGLALEAVRADAEAASQGATDFDQYFLYFSFFLLAAALLLAGLFFRLGVEQRLQELGLLRALGFAPAAIRGQLLSEGLALAAAGSVLGAAGSWAFAGLVLAGLRTIWRGAVGTDRLSLELSTRALAVGVVAGIATAAVVVAVTLRGVASLSPRALLLGAREAAGERRRHAQTTAWLGGFFAAVAVFFTIAARFRAIDAVAAFFAAGLMALLAALSFSWRLLAGPPRAGSDISLLGLGLRGATYRPGRSLLSLSLIAFASFVIVSVGAFRHAELGPSRERHSGTGGYALIAESLLPLYDDLDSAAGREALNLAGPDAGVLEGVRFARFRLRPGDDASCLNLYKPQLPRVLAPEPRFLEESRFAFAASLGEVPQHRENPWRLLDAEPRDGAIPAIADANSIAYVLHRKLGDVIEIDTPGAGRLRLRLVAALAGSVFQSELIVAERHFLRAFPAEDGYRVLLIDAPAGREPAVAAVLEQRLADQGLDVQGAHERLAQYHRVENTYIDTFQALGALGLLLGTVGLSAVILRNAAERRRELALLRAVGYRERHVNALVMAENALLLFLGVSTGALSALLAIVPALLERGGGRLAPIGGVLLAVLATGLVVSRLAVRAIVRVPVLTGLRTD
jgi:hypothetical protein